MSNSYTVTVKVEPTGFSGGNGHAFMTLSATGRADVTIGYYPQSGAVPYGVGGVKNDSISRIDKDTGEFSEHDYWPSLSKTFEITERQYADMLAHAAKAANDPTDMFNGFSGLPKLNNRGQTRMALS